VFNTDDRVLILEGNDPACNLAVEEALLSVCNSKSPDFDPLVLFYVNAPSIVVGKFQNPWLECDTAWISSQDIPVLRRISGGGTVWHDFGNINYSFILPRRTFDQKADLAALEKIFGNIGIAAISNDRGDLLLDGFKFSGNAMCYKNHAVLHHGTILIDSDLDRLRRALKAPLP
jgi:lipoate-protein ligase A